MKRLFSFIGKKPTDAAPPSAVVPHAPTGETTTFLTGDDRIDSRNVRLLLDTMAELISDSDPAALVRKIVDRAIRAVRAERGILLLRDPGGALAVTVARDEAGQDLAQLRYSTTVVNQVHESGEGVCLKIGDSERMEDLSASVVDLKLRAVMCVRLRYQEKVLGVIYVDSRVTTREFTHKDLRFFDALAVALSISLENARLIREALERQRLQQTLHIAQEVLIGLLPGNPVDIPDFDIAGRSVPAEDAAGDYYDFIRSGDGRLGMVVGDVTGHGMGPAVRMAGARAALRILFSQNLGEAEILQRLNVYLVADLSVGTFMSLVLCRLDPDRRLVYLANAGQSPPLILRRDGAMELAEGTGVALGIEAEGSYRNLPPIRLESGDLFVLFSDGILESRDSGDRMFGNEGIVAVLRQYRNESAASLVDRVYQNALQFSDRARLEDDYTMIVVKAL